MDTPEGVPSAVKKAAGAVALYVNVPFCERACSFCHYLPNLAFKHRDISDAYASMLLRQVRAVLAALPRAARLVSVYLGGGTPTLLSDAQIEALFALLEPWLDLEVERCIEVHPSSWRPSLARRGLFNRLSIGVQTFDRAQLKAWSRVEYGYEEVRAIVDDVRGSTANARLNVDLLFQTDVNKRDVLLARGLGPDSITLYPRTGPKRTGEVSHIYAEIQRARALLPGYEPLSARSFIFLRDERAISAYARLEHEGLGDVLGVGDWAVSLLGEDSYLSRYGPDSFRFEPRTAGDRTLVTFLRAVPVGVPDRLWRHAEPGAGPFLEPARPGLWRLDPAKTASFDAFLVSRGYSARHMREFRRGVLFGGEDPSLLAEACDSP
jgi:hypothetical protein